jgi:hypothetical protein
MSKTEANENTNPNLPQLNVTSGIFQTLKTELGYHIGRLCSFSTYQSKFKKTKEALSFLLYYQNQPERIFEKPSSIFRKTSKIVRSHNFEKENSFLSLLCGVSLSELISHFMHRIQLLSIMHWNEFTGNMESMAQPVFDKFQVDSPLLNMRVPSIKLWHRLLSITLLHETLLISTRIHLFTFILESTHKSYPEASTNLPLLSAIGALTSAIPEALISPLTKLHIYSYEFQKTNKIKHLYEGAFVEARYKQNASFFKIMPILYRYSWLFAIRGALIGMVHMPVYAYVHKWGAQKAMCHKQPIRFLRYKSLLIKGLDDAKYFKETGQAPLYAGVLPALLASVCAITLVMAPFDKFFFPILSEALIQKHTKLTFKQISAYVKIMVSNKGFLYSFRYTFPLSFARNFLFYGVIMLLFNKREIARLELTET